jgi:adenosine deaminase CECR1
VALELNAKRIAHGYAIKKDANILKECVALGKDKKLCVECCPISNEILGLHAYVKDAVVYTLMDKNIPCALASDNPTLFRYVLATP